MEPEPPALGVWSLSYWILIYSLKGSKSERERQIPSEITYMSTLKYDTTELIYKTETDSLTLEDRPMVTKEERG